SCIQRYGDSVRLATAVPDRWKKPSRTTPDSTSNPRLSGPVMAESADIEVRQLSKWYGGVPVLRDVSFSVPNGKSMALLGPSGCGKSTTLSIIAGVTHEDSGDVIIGGRDMKGL